MFPKSVLVSPDLAPAFHFASSQTKTPGLQSLSLAPSGTARQGSRSLPEQFAQRCAVNAARGCRWRCRGRHAPVVGLERRHSAHIVFATHLQAVPPQPLPLPPALSSVRHDVDVAGAVVETSGTMRGRADQRRIDDDLAPVAVAGFRRMRWSYRRAACCVSRAVPCASRPPRSPAIAPA